MTVPIALPMKAQIGLICKSIDKPQKLISSCLAAAEQLLKEMEINVVEVNEASAPISTPIPPPKER